MGVRLNSQLAKCCQLPVCQLARLAAWLKLAACSCNCICINYAAEVILQVVIRPDRHRQKTRRWKTEDRREKTEDGDDTDDVGALGKRLLSWPTLWQRLMLLLLLFLLLLLLAVNCIFAKR